MKEGKWMRKSATYELKKSATRNNKFSQETEIFERKKKRWNEKLNESNRNQQVNQQKKVVGSGGPA